MLVSLIGWWVQVAAINWLAYRLTDSPLLLGLTNFTALLPVGLFTLIGGVLVDRVPLRRLLLLLQAIGAAVAGGAVLLSATGAVRVWHVMILTFAAGSVNTVESSARIALMREAVADRRDLTNAVGLGVFMLNVARAAGPALSGFIIQWCGEAGSFLFNMLSYIAVVLALSLMRLPIPDRYQRGPQHLGRSLADGLRYAWHNPIVRDLIGLVVIFSFLVQPFVLLLPVFARDILQVGPSGYGLLMGALGLGAACGALGVAGLVEARRGLWLVLISIAFPGFLILYVLSPWLASSAVCLFLAGASRWAQYALVASLLQVHASDEFQGRVTSLFVLLSNGFPRLGTVLAGAAMERVRPVTAVLVASGLALIWGLYLVGRTSVVRQIR
jgi:MFS family permease